MPDSTLSTLNNIIIKVRRLTRSMSESVLPTSEIENYINTFVLYDFPEQIRLSSLRTTLTFYAQPNIDTYSTNTANPQDPLYNFKNKYISVHPPVYIAGYLSMFSQDRQQFFSIYPKVNSIASIGATGDDVTTSFTGTLANVPVLQENVLFTSIDSFGNGLTLYDIPASPQVGFLAVVGTNVPAGQINYITGAFTADFPVAPALGAAINSQTVPYVASQPQALLFFQESFVLRPVPDQPYSVQMEVYVRPTELLDLGQSPELSEWWQYIAYGAAKKIFEDRMDPESLAIIMPEFKQQQAMMLRRTIVQQTSERTSTIYTEQTAGAYGPGWWSGGGSF